MLTTGWFDDEPYHYLSHLLYLHWVSHVQGSSNILWAPTSKILPDFRYRCHKGAFLNLATALHLAKGSKWFQVVPSGSFDQCASRHQLIALNGIRGMS